MNCCCSRTSFLFPTFAQPLAREQSSVQRRVFAGAWMPVFWGLLHLRCVAFPASPSLLIAHLWFPVPFARFSPSLEPAVSSRSAPPTGFRMGFALLQEHPHFAQYFNSGYWISEALGLLGQRLTHVSLTWWAKWICSSFRSANFNAGWILLLNNSSSWLFPFELKAFYPVLGRRDLRLRSCEGGD